jgi:hypothetical protein
MSAIEIRVDQIAQLFDTLDPMPFHQKGLDRNAEDYIVGWARELPRELEIRILLHLPADEIRRHQVRAIEASLRNFFAYRAELTGRELKDLLRVGRQALAIGLLMLGLCFLTAQLVVTRASDGVFADLARESLLILGWVANWRPLEIFLYDWWPIVRRRDLYRRLAQTHVAFIEAPSTALG